MFVIGRTDEVGHERAVMVHLVNAGVAVATVDRSRRAIKVADVAVFELDRVCLLAPEAADH